MAVEKRRMVDVVLFGRGLGSLFCALLLQRRGAKVLVVDFAGSSDFVRQGDLANSFMLAAMLKRVGFHPNEVQKLFHEPCALQVIYGRHRMDFFGDTSRFLQELIREFPQDVEGFEKLFKDFSSNLDIIRQLFSSRVPFPAKGFMERRRLKFFLDQLGEKVLLEKRSLQAWVDEFGFSQTVSQMLKVLMYAYYGFEAKEISRSQLEHLIMLSRWERFGGTKGLKQVEELLLEKIESFGGSVVRDAKVQYLEEKRGKLVELGLDDQTWSMVQADLFLCSAHTNPLLNLLKKNSVTSWQKKFDALSADANRLFYTVKFDAKFLPVGIRNQGILIHDEHGVEFGKDRRKFPRASLYFILEDDDATKIHVSTLTHGLPAQEARSRIQDEILMYLERIIPFFPEGQRSDLMPMILDEEAMYGPHRTVYPKEDDEFGICGVDQGTPWKNMLFVGKENYPGLGLDGELLGAHQGYLRGQKLIQT